MSKKRHIILIPVYNDEKSLNKLLENIDINLNELEGFETEILILDDMSDNKITINIKEFINLKKMNILRVKKNLGSQKIIAVGLNYLKDIKEDFFVTIIDSDGEDNPMEIKKMLKLANENVEYVITSNRKSRKESILIKILYRLHLFITFLFTFKWITFGNYTTFNSNNIKKILIDKSSWLAHSSSVIKNCKIKRTYAKREKRYFDKSKLGLIKLVEHSLRVNAVFSNRILISTFSYIFLINIFFTISYLTILVTGGILFFYILILIIKKRHSIVHLKNCTSLIESNKSI